MHIGFLLLSAAASAAVASAFQDCDVSGTAELLVFSGTVNPRITVNRTLSAVVCEILRNSPGPAASCRVLGFTGIKLANGLVVRGGAADDVLLAAFAETDEVRGNVLAHSRAESARLRTGIRGEMHCAATAPTASPVKTTDCLKVPIVGPDSPPAFNLETDDGGCWVTECPSNNCYNYANDIVTNRCAAGAPRNAAPIRQNRVSRAPAALHSLAGAQGRSGRRTHAMRSRSRRNATVWSFSTARPVGLHPRHSHRRDTSCPCTSGREPTSIGFGWTPTSRSATSLAVLLRGTWTTTARPSLTRPRPTSRLGPNIVGTSTRFLPP